MSDRRFNLIAIALVGAVSIAGILGGPEAAYIAAGAVFAGLLLLALPRIVAPSPHVRTSVPEETLRPGGPPPSLRGWVIASIAVHLAAAIAINATGFNIAVAPDTGYYVKMGVVIAEAWTDPALDLESFHHYNALNIYQHINALSVYVFGEALTPYVLSIINGFLGTAAAYILSRLAHLMFGPGAVKRTFLLCAFFPSLILWTSINMREAWSFILLSGCLLSAFRLRERISVRDGLILAGCLAALPFIRSYFALLVGLGIALSLFVVRLRQLPAAVASVLLLIFLIGRISGGFGEMTSLTRFDLTEKLELMDRINEGLSFGGSAYDVEVDITTPGAAIAYLPKGVALFLLAPFPWSAKSWRQFMALPETFLWYFILYQALRAMWRGARKNLTRVAMPILVIVTTTAAYALIEGNEGTAYRHRAQTQLVFFVFAAGHHAWKLSRRRSAAGEPILAPQASAA